MAKATPKSEPVSETAVALRAKGGAVVNYDYGQTAGAGWENTDQDDFSVPFLNQLQALSPEVQQGEDTYVEGAMSGMFINSVTRELAKEIVFVPCSTQHVYVEWVSRDSGGGFVGVHALDSDVVREARVAAVQSGERNNLKSEAGNDLIETFYIYAAILEEAGSTEVADLVVMAFTKTKIKRYKAIMTRLRTMKGSKQIPLFAHQIRMTATKEKNAAGQPYANVELNPAVDGDVVASLIDPVAGAPILEGAQAFLESVGSGEAKANYQSTENEAAPSSTDTVF
jgi:hypothetical protein